MVSPSPKAYPKRSNKTHALSRRIWARNNMLRLQDVSTFYGAIQALDEISLNVNQCEIVTLIGANGAGKSTMLMSICGSHRARTGSISFERQDFSMRPSHNIMGSGIVIYLDGT